jgi:hypothetical protein
MQIAREEFAYGMGVGHGQSFNHGMETGMKGEGGIGCSRV